MADEKGDKGKKVGLKTQAQGFCRFIWNPDEHTFLGRGAKSWGQILLYYFIFYACLAGFFAINLSLFFTTISDDEPRLQGYNTLLKGHPGMGFRPQINGATLIKFNPSDESTYKDAVAGLTDFLAPYYNQTGPQFVNCVEGEPVPAGKVCKFDVANFGPCTEEHEFGYPAGKPCVLLKLNKVYGWVPDPNLKTDNGTCNYEYLNATGDCLPPSNTHIAITCEGEVAADRDNIGPVSLYPSSGLSFTYYPYKNVNGYVAPVVMAQFEHPKPGALVMVWCKAWAGNIYHDRTDQAGSVHFELEVDSDRAHH